MKKFLFVVVSLFLSLTFANANDLLFKASNGALNQNSLGVKKLSDEEMAQVRGGYFRVPYLDTRIRTYWLVTDDYYAKWGNGHILPTPGTATVRDKMGHRGIYVVILGVENSSNRLNYTYSFVAYDTHNKTFASQEFQSNNDIRYRYYTEKSLRVFKSYAKTSRF